MLVLFVAKFSLAVITYVHARKYNFFDTFIRDFLSISNDIFNSITARNTTCHRYGTVSAFVVATVLHF